MKHTKKYIGIILFTSFIFLLANACKEEEETFPTFDAPAWSANPANYSGSMTAVVKLPDNLIQYAQTDDQLAAFAGEECRGTGTLIKNDADSAYYVTIHGNADEAPAIYFQYYSARNKYLYQTEELFPFETDEVFGVADEPETLNFIIVK
jgi:hypothetical protein